MILCQRYDVFFSSKAIALEYKLDIKVKTGDVGVRTGMNSSKIPDVSDVSVIDAQVWKSYRRNKSAVIEEGVMLAVLASVFKITAIQ